MPEKIIGGIFHPDNRLAELAFKYAVEDVNADPTILPDTKLIARIERVPEFNSFQAANQVCSLLSEGAIAIFGPQSAQTASHVQSICDTVKIPRMETSWNFGKSSDSCSVNLYPHPTILSRAYVDLVKLWGCNSFTIVYETNEGLIRVQELLKAPELSSVHITVRQLDDGNNYMTLLKEIKNSGDSHIVLDCSSAKIYEILRQAQQIGIMNDYHSYLITSLDFHAMNFDEFRHSGTKITGFRLVNDKYVLDVAKNWKIVQNGFIHLAAITPFSVEAALMYDAVNVFAKALHELEKNQPIHVPQLSCNNNSNTWQQGYKLKNYAKTVKLQGLTNTIKFDGRGLRTDFVLDIMDVGPNGLRQIGTWNSISTTRVNITRSANDQQKEIKENFRNKTLVVSMILSTPFCMVKESDESLYGNDRYEGYAVDLTREISKLLGFNYKIELVSDYAFGGYSKSLGEWNGMIREILDQKADLAVADLSITVERQQAVDFTMPFMNLGISILHKKPVIRTPSIFFFLSPFSLNLWIYIAVAYLCVSVLFYFLARFTPYESATSKTMSEDKAETQLTLLNCMWFTIGSLMQQGCGILPKALSTRMLAGMWWFFTIIIISSYTANLVSFLTFQTTTAQIESINDLASQTRIQYGSIIGGSTSAFFRDSKVETYQRMWSFMKSRPSVFISNNAQGVERVIKENGNYAFLMETPAIEYVTARNCDLMQIGGIVDTKGFGIALPLNSPYRVPINGALLKLQREGKLDSLKTRWWKEKRGGDMCDIDDYKSTPTAHELGLGDIGGVFVVLIAGMLIAFLISVFEFWWMSRKADSFEC